MNNSQLKNHVAQFTEKIFLQIHQEYSELTVFLNESTDCSIVFYHLTNEEIFQKRLESAQYGCLILSRDPIKKPAGNYIVIPENLFQLAQFKLCNHFYPIQANKKIFGVTGTNGKTTTVTLATQIAQQNNVKAFSVGSLGVRNHSDLLLDLSGMTTPSLIDLRKILHKYFNEYDVVFMEVSSHALDQKRVLGIEFDGGAWTSFGRDHLDYHPTIEDYFNTKKKFPERYMKTGAPFWVPWRREELRAELKDLGVQETTSLKERGLIDLPNFFKTDFNKDNLEIALDMIDLITNQKTNVDLEKLTPPEGRFEYFQVNGKSAIIDSAHTPDALENLLPAIRQAFPNKKIIGLFGCGGNRDKEKRPLMAKAVEANVDKIVVTSDNPRHEDADLIIDDIVAGLTSDYERITDREKAVEKTVQGMTQDDLLLLLGKGAEKYIIVGDEKREYSDLSTFLKYASLNHD